ncbi:MAG: TIGR03857 family LLM class F420-dependent oxidoreductase [Pseudomonadales bacterium]|nr:TIGR03857 family LLM class F420-dependent oxidoreductase [Pseudomonadales bacterium]MCP5171151.1 TIGR03857 family LLM class F420-dependent oxidoreductase [Pseudomonadales bacterium]MCP5301611.1 TIGR03857 family LLM class F420-dependent oxidoreductase [Pseudomonadales bacterium]
MTHPYYPELGYWTLGGHIPDPTPLIDQAKEGERIGLSTVWISERPGTKDIGVLSGAALAAAPNSTIASGLIQNLQTRNPLVVASYASTMMLMTGNKFILGMGHGQPKLSDMFGVPRSTMPLIGRYIDTLKALWRGEVVTAEHDGWKLDNAALGVTLEVPPPIYMGAMGDKTLAWAGRHADGVILYSCLNKQAVEHSVKVVKTAAEEAGRNPADVKICGVAVTACDVSEEKMLNYIVRRMITYFMLPNIDVLIRVNGWDPDKAQQIKAAVMEDAGKSKGGMGDESVSRELDTLRRFRDMFPQEWINDCNAVGDADTCAGYMRMLLDSGADKVIIHGSPPSDLGSLLAAWPKHRPEGQGL